MLPLLLRQDGKKGGKKERFCHRILHKERTRQPTGRDSTDLLAGGAGAVSAAVGRNQTG